ncbi:hypothetical protein BCON_0015g00150 [Botryotinia convoluta]|uniref:Uncharacterized protein n=1 Tax=Botryotinia convoluta TaxID=54673 RepID=A0A4Z1J2L4_9HELO|nr:hypothetical protein BCON_0015g00150 [Botryotinia convoluta]
MTNTEIPNIPDRRIPEQRENDAQTNEISLFSLDGLYGTNELETNKSKEDQRGKRITSEILGTTDRWTHGHDLPVAYTIPDEGKDVTQLVEICKLREREENANDEN